MIGDLTIVTGSFARTELDLYATTTEQLNIYSRMYRGDGKE